MSVPSAKSTPAQPQSAGPATQGPAGHMNQQVRSALAGPPDTNPQSVDGLQSAAGNQRVQQVLAGTPGDGTPDSGSVARQRAQAALGSLSGAAGNAAIRQAALSGVSGATSRFPHAERIQSSFGAHDISHARAAIGGDGSAAVASLGARAFAIGSKAAFRSEPDLHLAAHEAAHIVQQRAGLEIDDPQLGFGCLSRHPRDSALDQAARPRLPRWCRTVPAHSG